MGTTHANGTATGGFVRDGAGCYGDEIMVATQYPTLHTPFSMLALSINDALDAFDRKRTLRFDRSYLETGPDEVP